MKRKLRILFTGVLLALPWIGAASAQQANNYFCNSSTVPCPPSGWTPASSANPLPVTGTVTATAPLGITPTDRTITSATGSSQTVMAANAARHGLIIENTGNANCGINPTGGTAVIGGAGTLTLVPFGSYSPSIPTLSAVTAICTAGQPLYASEN